MIEKIEMRWWGLFIIVITFGSNGQLKVHPIIHISSSATAANRIRALNLFVRLENTWFFEHPQPHT